MRTEWQAAITLIKDVVSSSRSVSKQVVKTSLQDKASMVEYAKAQGSYGKKAMFTVQ